MPLVQTRGAASAQGFGEFAQATAVNYIEDVFSTYLYTGNGSTQTITNGIDLSTYGGLTWIKGRSGATGHRLTDTARGATKSLASETTAAEATETTGLTAFGTTGFTIGADADYNTSAATYVSWTFREQPKFFDIVTYTGDGNTFQTINHNLGSTPGCIIAKQTNSGSTNWVVYHRELAGDTLRLNLTNAKTGLGGAMLPSSTSVDFYGGGGSDPLNASGGTYVAYLFAHDAGGFGLAGADNVISCGIMSSISGGTTTVNLGYEPQWVMVKRTDAAGSGWSIADISRGMFAPATYANELQANTSSAESAAGIGLFPLATGFRFDVGGVTPTWIYIAIRRGPMKVPTLGTSVLNITTSVGTNPAYVSSFPPDFAYRRQITGTSDNYFHTRLQGAKTLYTNYTVAEDDDANVTWAYQNGMFTSTGANANQYGWLMRRAPSFMDVVCYTGTGSNTTFTHNLGAVPELIIVKRRDTTGAWDSYSSALANTEYVVLNTTAAKATGATRWNSTTPTSSVFSVGTSTTTNASAGTYVAYLFATCAGVSKVGSYTGNGTTQTINCGFTGGARFVMIKRTDSTGGWYVYDTVRGMTVLTDPYVFLNDNAVQVATLGSVTTVSTGFALDSAILAAINESGGSYIFLAIA